MLNFRVVERESRVERERERERQVIIGLDLAAAAGVDKSCAIPESSMHIGWAVLEGTDNPFVKGGYQYPLKSDNPLLLKFGEILQPQLS